MEIKFDLIAALTEECNHWGLYNGDARYCYGGYISTGLGVDDRVQCTRCKGKGRVLTQVGYDLLGFIKDYSDED